MAGAFMKLEPLSTPNTQQAFFDCSPNSPLLDRSSRSVGGCAGLPPDLLRHRPPISGLVLLPETHIITVVQRRSPAAHSFVFESVNVDQRDNDNSIISRIISSMLDSIGSTSARTGNTANDIREMISERLARASSDGGISDSTHPHPNPSNSQRGSRFSSATPLGPQNPALKIRKVREEIKMNKSEKNRQNQQIASLEKQMVDSMSETEKNMDKLGLSPSYAEVLEQLNEKSFELEIGDVVDETKNASCVDVRHSRIFCRQF